MVKNTKEYYSRPMLVTHCHSFLDQQWHRRLIYDLEAPRLMNYDTKEQPFQPITIPTPAQQ